MYSSSYPYLKFTYKLKHHIRLIYLVFLHEQSSTGQGSGTGSEASLHTGVGLNGGDGGGRRLGLGGLGGLGTGLAVSRLGDGDGGLTALTDVAVDDGDGGLVVARTGHLGGGTVTAANLGVGNLLEVSDGGRESLALLSTVGGEHSEGGADGATEQRGVVVVQVVLVLDGPLARAGLLGGDDLAGLTSDQVGVGLGVDQLAVGVQHKGDLLAVTEVEHTLGVNLEPLEVDVDGTRVRGDHVERLASEGSGDVSGDSEGLH